MILLMLAAVLSSGLCRPEAALAVTDNWTRIAPDEAYLPYAVSAMSSRGSSLYTCSERGKVWEYDGSAWRQINEDYFGDTGNYDLDSMAV